MTTRIVISNTSQANYPYLFKVKARTFCLQQYGKKWELMEYKDDNTYPVYKRWSSRKDHWTMLGEAFEFIMIVTQEVQP